MESHTCECTNTYRKSKQIFLKIKRLVYKNKTCIFMKQYDVICKCCVTFRAKTASVTSKPCLCFVKMLKILSLAFGNHSTYSYEWSPSCVKTCKKDLLLTNCNWIPTDRLPLSFSLLSLCSQPPWDWLWWWSLQWSCAHTASLPLLPLSPSLLPCPRLPVCAWAHPWTNKATGLTEIRTREV